MFDAVTRKQAVLRQLRHEIQTGELAPGDLVVEGELASRLGVSVTPVREAVVELISEGIVQGEPNKRKRVAVVTQREAIELADYQGILLVAALRRTAGRISAEERSGLALLLRSFAAALRSGDLDGASKSFGGFAEQCASLSDQWVLAAQLRHATNRSIYRLSLYPHHEIQGMWTDGADETALAAERDGVLAAADRLDKLISDVVAYLRVARPLPAPVPHAVLPKSRD